MYRQSANPATAPAPTQTGIYGLNGRPAGFERIKRPSTLVKPFATSMTSTTTTTSNSTFTNGLADSAEIGKHGVFTTLGTKPNYASINKILTNSRSNYNTVENDDQFPPPPPSNQLASGDELNDVKYIQISKTPPSFFYIEDEFKRKKFPFEESYCIVKELVMTERTYKKDLEVLTSDFRQFTSNIGLGSELPLLESLLYSQALQPIYQFHTQFLKDLEIRLFHWTEKMNPASDEANNNKIGDLLNNLNLVLKYYKQFVEKQEDLLVEIDGACKRSKRVDNVFREFEAQKVCYLPFILFLAKPIQRLIHYKLLFERLLICYGPKHRDYHDTYNVYAKLEELSGLVDERLPFIENKQKLMELQRDLQGADAIFTNLAKNNRQFVREGSLQKLSRKGYQQRMFFLFNDVLLYCARSSNPVLQFKVHGEYHLRHLQIEDGNPHVNIPNSFTIYTSNRSLLLSTVSQDEKNRWIEDLYECIEKCKSSSDDKAPFYPSLKSNSSSDNNLDTAGTTSHDEHNDQGTDCSTDQQNSVLSAAATNGLDKKPTTSQHRANTTIHVCWHRNTSVSMVDIHKSVINHLSGYLLRKFKNSNGWQKLWVVFTNFCLFFYKTYQDEFPLASLPLLGYSITVPTEADNINKDYVFKLQFKNHVYFFRAESQYSFDRWLEVIESAAEKQGGV